jgi:hypothetical protein
VDGKRVSRKHTEQGQRDYPLGLPLPLPMDGFVRGLPFSAPAHARVVCRRPQSPVNSSRLGVMYVTLSGLRVITPAVAVLLM